MIVKKPEAHRHYFVLEELIHASLRFPIFEASTIRDQMNSSLYFIGFIIAQIHQGQSQSLDLLFQYEAKKFRDIFRDLVTAKIEN